MSQQIGIVSKKIPCSAHILALKKNDSKIFWFAEIQAAFVHVLSSCLDGLYIDEDLDSAEQFCVNNYILKCRLFNPELAVTYIKLAPAQKPQPIPKNVSYFASLENIIENSDLKIYFQPIIKPNNNKDNFYGLECLARITNHDITYSPEFIFNYAQEKFSLVDYDKKCLEVAMSSAPLSNNIHIFLNIRPQTLICHNFISWLKNNIIINRIDAERLVIELTEQYCLFNESKLKERCTELRSMGIKLAMDDFGLGMSNLSLFEAIKPKIIKVAGRFIKDVQGCTIKQKIVKNVIELAEDFAINAIVENVETKDEWDMANSLGAQHAQGYYFYKPLTQEGVAKCFANRDF